MWRISTTLRLICLLKSLDVYVESVDFSLNSTDVISNHQRLEKHTGCCLTEVKCKGLCAYHQNCKSFFYSGEKDQCQLHSVVPNTTHLQPDLGWSFYISIEEDCDDHLKAGETADGVYKVKINGNMHDIWCDMTGGGEAWTVFQKRFDGSEDFYRGWGDYAHGFGNISDGEFWLGNEVLHELTSMYKYKLRIDLEDHDGVWKYAEYSTFSISSNGTGYTLHLGEYTGTVGDSLGYHNASRFATKDNDVNQCSANWKGAWWYVNCHWSNLNGIYNSTEYAKGVNWSAWMGTHYSMRKTLMKIQRV